MGWSAAQALAAVARSAGEPMPPLAHAPPVASTTAALLDATIAALRCDPTAIRRRGAARRVLVDLAFTHGLLDPAAIAELCQCHPRTIGRMRGRADPVAVHAARRCLANILRLSAAPG